MKTLILRIALALILVPPIKAQDDDQDYLNAHNRARATVGMGPLQWDDDVASYAEDYANSSRRDFRLIHSSGPYGENIAWSSGELSGVAAVQLWLSEKDDYDYRTNTCRNGKVCGHYTQIVWRNTARLGCAKVECDNGGGTFIICNYNPRGNVNGQWPY